MTNNYTEYRHRLDTLDKKFPVLIDAWKKYYVFTKKTPDYAEYKSQFSRISTELDNIDMDLQKINGAISSDVARLNAQAATVNDELANQRANVAQLDYEQTQIEAKYAATTTRERNFQHELAAVQWRQMLLLGGLGLLTVATVAV